MPFLWDKLWTVEVNKKETIHTSLKAIKSAAVAIGKVHYSKAQKKGINTFVSELKGGVGQDTSIVLFDGFCSQNNMTTGYC